MKKYAVRERRHDLLIDHLLYHRNFRDPKAIADFLNPDYDAQTHDPYLLKDMDKAVGRILQAIKKNEKTVIYSDYDTDGIPAGVALHDFFKKIGYTNFSNYIPHRHDEGFGLNSDAVEQFGKNGTDVLITIDCGISDIVPVREAKKAGIDVIITDHHIPHAELPAAYAIINPKQADCAYPEKMLCGAGVVYKLIQALLIKSENRFGLKDGYEKWLLDMVGIATLSDMVPLTGENRVFAYYGLKVLRKSPRLGLQKLLKKLRVDQRELTEEDIGFTIGPRINAASSMGVPMDAFRLLATEDEAEADQFVEHLNQINDERKTTVALMAKEIKKMIRARFGEGNGDADGEDRQQMPKVIVMGNPQWRPSLLGLAANSVAEEYGRPVFLWGRDGDNVIKGSCRSDGVTNLLHIMQHVPKNTFLQYGGHAFSGGFSVGNDEIHTLADVLNAAAIKMGEAAVLEDGSLASADFVDSILSVDEVNWDTYKSIERLAPFGTGNPKPLFMLQNVIPQEVKGFGKEKNHLELLFRKTDGKKVSAIGFFMTAEKWSSQLGRGRVLKAGYPLTLVASFEKSMFRGFPELRLRIVDIL